MRRSLGTGHVRDAWQLPRSRNSPPRPQRRQPSAPRDRPLRGQVPAPEGRVHRHVPQGVHRRRSPSLTPSRGQKAITRPVGLSHGRRSRFEMPIGRERREQPLTRSVAGAMSRTGCLLSAVRRQRREKAVGRGERARTCPAAPDVRGFQMLPDRAHRRGCQVRKVHCATGWRRRSAAEFGRHCRRRFPPLCDPREGRRHAITRAPAEGRTQARSHASNASGLKRIRPPTCVTAGPRPSLIRSRNVDGDNRTASAASSTVR